MSLNINPPVNLDIDLDQLAKCTYSAVFSDICDSLGYWNQTAAPGIAPLSGPGGVVIGWARTAWTRPVEAIPARPYGNEIDYLDSLRKGDLAVIDCSERPAAAWGELFSTASQVRGARGAIVDGYIRDREKIQALNFPVFGRGGRPTDSLGRISIQAIDEEIQFGGVKVKSGDLIVADADGVTVVPQAIAKQAIELAMEKALKEDGARDMLRAGGTMRQAWEKYRVL